MPADVPSRYRRFCAAHVSGTQLLTVQCADETRYYRDGQQVERFILKKEDGTQTYVYESEDVVTQEQGVFEKG